jgi:lipoprotein-anchoring transpeptidase ErfK/SrfK
MKKRSSFLLSLAYLVFLPFILLYCLPTQANTFIFNPNTLSWKAIDSNGKVVRSGRGSGGRKYCPDIGRGCKTPSGVYTVWSKGGPGCVSSRYPVGRGGAPMPYCMYFSKNYAIHGSYEVPHYNASHGCIRLIPSDARWLSNNFIRIGTKVVVRPY